MEKARGRGSLLWLVAMGFFMETLDSTIVNTAVPAMAQSLGESPLAMHSIIVAYSLTIAILIPASGWIADRFGTRRAYFTAIVLFTIGSLLCASSHTVEQLVAARIVQGIGGSMLLPVGRLTVLRSFPGPAYIGAITFVSTPGLIGPLIGPTLGGWLVAVASWHWIFLINLPIGLIGGWATLRLMPDLRAETRRRFDVKGYVMLAVSMLTISVALNGISEPGLQHLPLFVAMIFGLAALAAYWLYAGRVPEPLFRLTLFRTPTFTIGLLGNLFARLGSGSMPFLLPLFLQVGLGHSPLRAGMMMIPVAAAGILGKRPTPALLRRFGYRRLLIVNTLCVGGMIVSFATLDPSSSVALLLAQLFAFGAVNSLQFTAMNSLTLSELDPASSSSGNSLFSMVQLLAMGLGVAAGGALLNAFMGDASGAVPGALKAFHWTFACVGVLTCSSTWIFAQLPSRTRKASAAAAEAPVH